MRETDYNFIEYMQLLTWPFIWSKLFLKRYILYLQVKTNKKSADQCQISEGCQWDWGKSNQGENKGWQFSCLEVVWWGELAQDSFQNLTVEVPLSPPPPPQLLLHQTPGVITYTRFCRSHNRHQFVKTRARCFWSNWDIGLYNLATLAEIPL